MTDQEKAVVMAYTGVVMLKGDKLSIFYEYASQLLGRPVFTHELADNEIVEKLRIRSLPDFRAICEKEE